MWKYGEVTDTKIPRRHNFTGIGGKERRTTGEAGGFAYRGVAREVRCLTKTDATSYLMG